MSWRVLGFLTVWIPAALASCLAVREERILARDLAAVLPEFAALPPNLALGYAPAPGGVRTFTNGELARLARRYGFEVEKNAKACFVGAIETLTRARVEAAMQSALPGAGIEVLDFSRQPVPAGELHFPIAGLAAPQASATPSALLWRGQIVRSGQSDFPVWAKARIRMRSARTVAVETIRPGRPVESVQIRVEAYDGPARFPVPAQIVGRISRRTISAGETILAQWLEQPPEVQRGERVQVEVRSGSARLLLEGQAQSAGRRGDWIPIRNPASGRVFRARVQDRKQVSVTPGWSAPSGGSR